MSTLIFTPIHPTKGLYQRTLSQIEKQDAEVVYSLDNPYDNKLLNVAHNFGLGREYVLEGDWDYMLAVEADIIIPDNALELLLEVDADIVYGLYCFRQSHDWNIFRRLDHKSGKSLSRTPSLARKYWGKVINTLGLGTGCTLIKREVLEEIYFRSGTLGHDWEFALEAKRKGFTQKAHLGVLCGHINNDTAIYPSYSDMARLERQEYFRGANLDELHYIS